LIIEFHFDPIFLFIVDGGGNKQHSTNKNTAKLDRETEELHHDTVKYNGSLSYQIRGSPNNITVL
jgi:hypothetical protein